MPGPLTGALDVEPDGQPREVVAGLAQRPRQHPDGQVDREVDRPVLPPDLPAASRTPFVARMSSPCRNHSTTCDCTRNRGAMSPANHGNRASRHVVIVELGGVDEERVRGRAPGLEHVAGSSSPERRATVHAFHPSTVNGLLAELSAVRVELLGRFARQQLGRRRVERPQVGHHVTVPPAGGRARVLPGVGLGELHHPAEPLPLGVRDGQELLAIDRHAVPYLLSRPRVLGTARRARTSAATSRTVARCASSSAPTSSEAPLRAAGAADAIARGWRRAGPTIRSG